MLCLRPLQLAVLLMALSGAAMAGTNGNPGGFPRVDSGDTLRFGALLVRLHGIKAPPPGTICRVGGITYRCGTAAREALERAIGAYAVRCFGRNEDMLFPLPATCRRGAVELNLLMLRLGWAVVDEARCGNRCRTYRRWQAAAQQARRGLWIGELPDALRSDTPRSAAPPRYSAFTGKAVAERLNDS